MRTLALALSTAGCLAATAAIAQPRPERAAVGTLECNVAPGVGLIVASKKEMTCRFHPANGRDQIYYGTITRVGLDIGVTGHSVIIWNVLAPTRAPRAGELAGTYTGVGAQATAGVGAGANALIGGSNRTVTLQPLSVSAQTGINLAAGIGSITLRYEGQPARRR